MKSLSLATVTLALTTCSAQAQPDVLVVVLDDVRATDVAYLPSVQELAERGTSYSRAFAAFSLCTPSRASLLTGNTPAVHGLRDNRGQNFDPSSTIATWFNDAGYRTGLVGKYVNGAPSTGWPQQPGWDYWRPLHHHADYARQQSAVLEGWALEFLRDPDPRPRLLYLAPAAAHWPNRGPRGVCDGPFPPMPTPPNFDFSMLSELETEEWPQRMSALCGADILIRNVLAEIDLSRTVVVITSDQGFSLGERGDIGKNTLFDEVIRVPLVIAGPGFSVGESPRIVSTIDIAPTLADSAGVPHPDVEGRSLLTGPERRFAPIESWDCTGKRRAHSKVAWCGDVTRTWDLIADPLEVAPTVVGAP